MTKNNHNYSKTLLQQMSRLSRKPRIFAKSTAPFWDDKHISKSMLELHLAPNVSAASRKHSFIDRSVKWLVKEAKLRAGSKVLDLGCGPGMYCARLADRGIQVTGIDISKRSLDYARREAKRQGHNIRYKRASYMSVQYGKAFDLAILIYRDLSVLSNKDRDTVLKKTYAALKPRGCFVFDVSSKQRYALAAETNQSSCEESGFWRPKRHRILTNVYKYPEQKTILTQCVVASGNNDIDCYRIWDHCYIKKEVVAMLAKVGFRTIGTFGDVAGKKLSKQSKTIAVIAQKP